MRPEVEASPLTSILDRFKVLLEGNAIPGSRAGEEEASSRDSSC
jgi:hypothetical protein